MCGICGVVALDEPLELLPETPGRMIGVMRHRGPDEFGAWRDDSAFLGHARLSIIDLETGQQPLCNEDGRYWITFNGEIFNYPELTAELEGLGHVFRTRSDTETIIHAYEQWGQQCVDRFNGQFAFAIWDRRERRLFLARDRFGIRPLFLAWHDGRLLFASEIKALRAYPGFAPEIDPTLVGEVFNYWVNIPPATVFRGVAQLPPGHTAVFEADPKGSSPPAPLPSNLRIRRYWQPTFLSEKEDRRHVGQEEIRRMAGQVREKLVEAATIRLRADVPVGAYLSGGLDSSTTTALIHAYTDHHLKTFSVGFDDPAFDETSWQLAMAEHIGTDHATVKVGKEDIASRFRQVVWLTETPILRTAPAPLHALSALARSEGFKVVLTGEGADEVFAGYNIFREAKVRWFWSRDPGSRNRSLLLTRLYPYLAQSPPEFLRRFYGAGLDRPDDPCFSHRPRWNNTSPLVNFLAPEGTAAITGGKVGCVAEERLLAMLPDDFAQYGPVAKAQYLEMTTFMAGYLLSSQGDRMLMGNSVEGRFPFLDHELADFAGTLPATVKLQSLTEKAILKKSVADLLPANILDRPKQPYRAPDSSSFAGRAGQELVDQYLDVGSPGSHSLWKLERVPALVRKWQAGKLLSIRDNMAFVGLLSGRILAEDFGPGFESRIAGDILEDSDIAWRSE
ncbi:MAG: asparagine synthase (glutamine-hydrolyzing) [Gemmatimonadales bacterium]|nr:asparagine synthase (glutamine-hydrolyzing) [Gemmatimonadales bacterium]